VSFARIAGVGGYLPERVVTNAELEALVDTSDAWIRERTGIRQRHMAAEHETTCDLAEHAARAALADAGLEPGAVDLIILATTTPDLVFPSTACLVQERLGSPGCAAFDIQAVCSGFIYALAVADRFLRTGGAATALVIGAETFTRIIDWTDRKTCVLFGDGAGAVVLRQAEAPGVISTHLHADGRHAALLQVPAGVSANRAVLDAGRAFVEMEGNQLFKVAVRCLSGIVAETLAAAQVKAEAIDWLIPHQANSRIIMATARKLGLPPERVVMTVAEHGNTSAASVPLALATAVGDGRIARGDLLLLEAFGGGLTWGSALIRY